MKMEILGKPEFLPEDGAARAEAVRGLSAEHLGQELADLVSAALSGYAGPGDLIEENCRLREELEDVEYQLDLARDRIDDLEAELEEYKNLMGDRP